MSAVGTMDRDTVIRLLPCYVCGDLPEGVAAAVAAAVAADPELQVAVGGITVTQQLCLEGLRQAAPEVGSLASVAPDLPARPVPDLAEVRPPVVESASRTPRWLGPALGLAAAALLAVTVGQVPAPDLVADAAELHQLATAGTLLHQSDSQRELHAALVAAGVPPMRAVVPDMSGLGMKLVGAMRTPDGGPGVVVVYEKEGQRYSCQFIEDFASGAQPVLWREVGGTLVRVVQQGDQAMVVWEGQGMVCIFSGPGSASQLLAMVEMRLTARG